MKAIEILLKQFEGFIKRAILPSISFIFTFLFVGTVFTYLNNTSILDLYKNYFFCIDFTMSFWILSIIILIGFSLFLSILSQAIFDNYLKNSFNSRYFTEESILLEKYRFEVIKKLKESDSSWVNSIERLGFTDNNLYQIVMRDLSSYSIKTTTTRYVDDAKAIGIMFLSFFLSIILWSIKYSTWWGLLSFVLFFIARELIKSKYRSRALRIYVNYLLGDNKKNKDETKNCTTYICKETKDI